MFISIQTIYKKLISYKNMLMIIKLIINNPIKVRLCDLIIDKKEIDTNIYSLSLTHTHTHKLYLGSILSFKCSLLKNKWHSS